jgi:hypothetical protein
MIIIRLFFIISAFFVLLALGLAAALFFKMRFNSFLRQNDRESKIYRDDSKVIEGEYKVIDESHKD